MVILNMKLNHILCFNDFQICFSYPRKLKKTTIQNEYNSNALKELKAIIGNLGYCIAAEKKINNYNYVFSLHPKFIYEVTDYVYNNCDGILYHITDVNTYQKIIKNGLIPRSN